MLIPFDAAWPEADETVLCNEHLALQSPVDDFLVGCQLGPCAGRATTFMDRLWYSPGIVHHFLRDDWLRTRIMDGKDTSAISRGG